MNQLEKNAELEKLNQKLLEAQSLEEAVAISQKITMLEQKMNEQNEEISINPL